MWGAVSFEKTHTLWRGSHHSRVSPLSSACSLLFYYFFSSLLVVFCLFPENNVIGIFVGLSVYKGSLSLSYDSTLVFMQKVLVLEVKIKWKGISKRASRRPSLLSSLSPSKSLILLLLLLVVGFLGPFFHLHRPRPRCVFHFSTLISVLTLLLFSSWSNKSLCFSFFCISWLSLCYVFGSTVKSLSFLSGHIFRWIYFNSWNSISVWTRNPLDEPLHLNDWI